MRLKGKVVVVTGASRGVGRGIGVALGAEMVSSPMLELERARLS